MSRNTTLLAVLITALLVVAALFTLDRHPPAPTGHVPDFTIPLGKVRTPLPYRIISFHRGGVGRDARDLIKLAAQLGFNGVQFQLEGPNEDALTDFAARDAREHLVDYCHSLGMKVTVWVHELSDLPGAWMPEYLGPASADNQALWATLDQRYDHILSDLIPNVDGLVLTVVETQVKATPTPILLRLVDLLDRKCRAHGKSLIVRTFVWKPEELASVMAAVDQFPSDTLLMTKAVAQDWQMRGVEAPELGAVGGRPQIEEFDAAGEYFLKNSVANCMVDLLKRQFDTGLAKGIQGICVRVDRDDDSILWQPNEVNLWALGLLAAGAADSADDIWMRWATYRYGAAAAPAVIRALRPTSDVVAEMLSIGPFTFGDTRNPLPPLPRPTYEDQAEVFTQNWQNWRWDSSLQPLYDKADSGDPDFIAQVAKEKQAALRLADQCLADLEKAKPDLSPPEYAILRTRLLTNKFQLSFRAPMAMADLYYRQYLSARGEAATRSARDSFKQAIADIRAVAASERRLPEPDILYHLGRAWPVNIPDHPTRDSLYLWAYKADAMMY